MGRRGRCRRLPRSGGLSARCMPRAASSFRTRTTSAGRAISRRSASRRWRRPAPGAAFADGYPDGQLSREATLDQYRGNRRGDRRAGQRRLRQLASPRRGRGGGREREALRRDRRRRPLDRGLDTGDDEQAALRSRRGGRAGQGGARGDRRCRRRRHPGGAGGVLPGRLTRSFAGRDPPDREPTPRRARTASTRPGRASATTSPRSSRRWHRSRSTCSSAARSA